MWWLMTPGLVGGATVMFRTPLWSCGPGWRCCGSFGASWSGTVATSGTRDSKRADPLVLLLVLEDGEGDFPYSWYLRSEESRLTPPRPPPRRCALIGSAGLSPVRLVGRRCGNELLRAVNVGGVGPRGGVGPGGGLPLPRRVSLLLDGGVLALFGQLGAVAMETVVGAAELWRETRLPISPGASGKRREEEEEEEEEAGLTCGAVLL